MPASRLPPFSCFDGHRLVASGTPEVAALALKQRRHSERAYHFLQTIAGDLPGFEEAIRVLFAHGRAGLEMALRSWPEDVRNHALRLAFDDSSDHADG